MKRTVLAALLLSGATLPALAAPTPHQAQAREIYRAVIGYPTAAGSGQVPAMAQYLAARFRDGGFPAADVHVLPLGETASLVVRYRGDGSAGKKPILLMAHMDVVPADPKDWRRDPFTLVEENGYFFGRGAADVKDGVATLAATFLRLKAEGFVPTRDLVILFSGDEETTGATAQDLVRNHRDLVDAEYALNSDGGGGTLGDDGKPLVYSLQTAEKTYASYEFTVRNPGGHSSTPRPDNAIYDLADALLRLREHRFPVQSNDSTREYFRVTGQATPGALGEAMRRFAADPGDAAAAEVIAASPSDVGKTRTTCVATMLRGGHAENALPQSATATVNCRIFPGVAVDAVRQSLQDVAGADVEVATLGAPMASDASPLRPDVVAAVEKAVHAIHAGVPIVPEQSSGASDGLYLRAAGIPTYGTAGMFARDNDTFAHGLDERVPVKGFYDGLEFWYVLVKAVSAPAR